MNRNVIFSGTAFVVGLAAGAFGSYIWCKKKFERDLEQEIAEFKKEYRLVHVDFGQESASVEPEKKNYKESNGIPENVRERVEIDQTAYHRVKAPYMKPEIVDMDFGVDPGETAEDVLAKAEHPEDGTEEDHVLISIDEFMSDMTEYDKEGLIWYLGDNVVTDQYGDVVDNVDYLLGEVLDAVDTNGAEDGSSIFVRNRVLNVDYEITVMHMSHEELIE